MADRSRIRELGKVAAPLLRLPALVGAVSVVALAALAVSVGGFVSAPLSVAGVVGCVLLLAAATTAEAFPVPIGGVATGGVSQAAVFIVAAGLLYGWEAAALIAFCTRGMIEVAKRRPPSKVLYNCSTYALSGAAAGLAASAAPSGRGVAWLIADVFLGAAAFYLVNVILIVGVVSCASRQPFVTVMRQAVASTALAFAIMSR